MEATRKIEVRRNGEWIGWEFEDVKEGDVFRLFEPDGSIVKRGEFTIFVATGPAEILDIPGYEGKVGIPNFPLLEDEENV